MRHVPVMIEEVTNGLALKPGMTVVDCTLGDAGHSEAILATIGERGKLIGIDADPEAILRAKQILHPWEKQITLVRANFAELGSILQSHHVKDVDAILMDLGWSTPQFAERGRGFSFLADEPLDMRFNPQASNGQATAADILNTESAAELTKIFKQYGEEKFAQSIAERVVKTRKEKPIARTTDLNEIVLAVYREKLNSTKEIPWIGGNHPATQTYQALRIAVNKELDVLKETIPQAISTLKTGGRLAVITFHSLEDRIVKHLFKAHENKTIKLINKKPLVPTEQEEKENVKSRSAKLRIIEKL